MANANKASLDRAFLVRGSLRHTRVARASTRAATSIASSAAMVAPTCAIPSGAFSVQNVRSSLARTRRSRTASGSWR
ncbi:MAG: hypothetical protein WA931_17555 [Rhodococcus sp. (in: high G+C Gram-positive bacteria)]